MSETYGMRLAPSSAYTLHACRYRPTARDVARDQRRGLWEATAVTLAVAFCIAFTVFMSYRMNSTLSSYEMDVTYEQVIVKSGESLWSLSEEHPVRGMTTQQVVSLVAERNELSTVVIQPGQVLLMPATTSSVLVA